jgi:type II secretory ATPase GspE/PulE/Tfp pilus assembly ATPase PilB-like protein
MTPQLRELILTRPSAAEIKNHLHKGNWRDLKTEGIRCAEQGLTSIEEMMRVCFIEEEPAKKTELVSESSD